MEQFLEEAKVSIIIPCYNVERYIETCCKSLKNQTYKNIEVIFVNDGSKDNTLEKIKKHSVVLKDCKIVDKVNGGVSSARNAGLRILSGDFVYFYDPDDILAPETIESFLNLITKHNVDLASCNITKVKDGIPYESYKFKQKKEKLLFFDKTDAMKNFLAQKYFDFGVCNKIYSTKILKENNITFFETCRYGEDILFNYEYIKHAKHGAVFTKQELYYYVQRKTSLIHSKFNENRLNSYYSLNTIVKNTQREFEEVVDYAYSIRAMVACEMLYFIKKSSYNNAKAISKVIEFISHDIKYLKNCKEITCFRRTFIPLVPGVAKLLLKKRLREDENKAHILPECMAEKEFEYKGVLDMLNVMYAGNTKIFGGGYYQFIIPCKTHKRRGKYLFLNDGLKRYRFKICANRQVTNRVLGKNIKGC